MRRGLLAGLLFLLAAIDARAAPACEPVTFENASYTICTFDTRRDRLALYNLDAEGRPFGSFARLEEALKAQGKELAFAMNAGMYDDSLKPIGLYIENRKQMKKINRRDGAGNFHLKPNGVFFIDGDRAGILETSAYLKSKLKPDFATQSGPMLVVDGGIHPQFSATSTSFKRRNGAGVVDDHTVVFAISEGAVTFHSFARLFRDRLDCRNALFFDGSISSLHAPELGRSDSLFLLGPVIGLAK